MKVKKKETTLDEMLSAYRPPRKSPPYPGIIFRTLVRLLSIGELKKTRFTYEKENFKKLPKGPCLILMNHSSFIDLKIASKILYPKCYNIIATADAMLGKEWLMRRLGCVATKKFAPDVPLALDIIRLIKRKKRSVLMYPEAGYSFDGTATVIPKSVSSLIKKLGVPVVTIISDGAYLYDPLYNELKKRKVKVSAKAKILFSSQQIKEKTPQEIQNELEKEFSFDNFKAQYEKGVLVTEPTRADGLHRVLYRCPNCNSEGKTIGKGETLTCTACGKTYRLEENGRMKALDGNTEFEHIPDWYKWQRECVKEEFLKGEYKFEEEVDIGAIYGYKAFNVIEKGKLTHDASGFKLEFYKSQTVHTQSPIFSYSVNVDFYWYEGGDIISIGNSDVLYYCFPKAGVPVAKVRLAAEEMYKYYKNTPKAK